MLLCNYSQLNANPGRNIGGFSNSYEWLKGGTLMNFYTGDASVANVTDRASLYNGYTPPYTIRLAPKAGGIGSINFINGLGSVSAANLAGGLNGVAPLTGTGTLTANITALGNMISALAGTGAFSADITGSLGMAAALAGSGDLVGALGALISIEAALTGVGTLNGVIAGAIDASATIPGVGTLSAAITGSVAMIAALAGIGSVNADITGAWSMVSALSGSGSVVADLRAIGNIISGLTGTGSLAGSVGAIGDMEADIIIGASDPLSPENLAIAVWESLAASFNSPGTMGEIMNNMGAVADPWTVALEGTYTAGEMLKILTAVAAGKSTIVDLGGGAATVTFRDINDTKNRVIADMNDSERTTVTLDET